MTIVHTLAELRSALATMPGDPLTTRGFVPTMGFLHDGHMSLVDQARKTCTTVVVSIFVNPTQFGPTEDFAKYPRDEKRDLSLCESHGVDIVWLPSVPDLYPDPDNGRTWVEVEGPSDILEGALRPGHFRGVATVVCKLLNAVGPCTVFLGQKDAQQVAVIRRMVEDLFMPHRVQVCPIVREPEGLAMSSRNTYLSPEQHAAALALHRGLSAAASGFSRGESDPAILSALAEAEIRSEPGLEAQYVSVLDARTFRLVEKAGEGNIMALAVRCGSTRLIDNLILGENS